MSTGHGFWIALASRPRGAVPRPPYPERGERTAQVRAVIPIPPPSTPGTKRGFVTHPG